MAVRCGRISWQILESTSIFYGIWRLMMSKRFLFNVVWRLYLTFVSCFSFFNACHADDCINKTYFTPNAKITVSGIIESAVFWGPPNFGENPKTDQRYTGAILHLDCPVYTPENFYSKSDPWNVYFSISKDNLVAVRDNKVLILNVRMEEDDEKRVAYRRHNGWRAKITGTVREARLPSDHTPIVLDEIDTEWLSPTKKSRRC
jgi:hypothetical protein